MKGLGLAFQSAIQVRMSAYAIPENDTRSIKAVVGIAHFPSVGGLYVVTHSAVVATSTNGTRLVQPRSIAADAYLGIELV
jgi:hypothetical protein